MFLLRGLCNNAQEKMDHIILEKIKKVCSSIGRIEGKYEPTNTRRENTLQELKRLAREFYSYTETYISDNAHPKLLPEEAIKRLEEKLRKILKMVESDHQKNKIKFLQTQSRLGALIKKIIEKNFPSQSPQATPIFTTLTTPALLSSERVIQNE